MTKEDIGITLKQLRLTCGMTQKEVAEKLGRKQQIVGHWETGYAQPDANTLFTLCEIYGTTVDEAFGFIRKNADISSSELDHIKKYRSLDDYGRESVDLILNRESQRVAQIARLSEYAKRLNELERKSEKESSYIRTVPYYESLASAGTGQILWDDLVSFDMEIANNERTKRGDFALNVKGESMEPIYWDMDTILVEKTSDLQIGEIGVFILDGECYIKELGYKQLISKNPKYKPIKINDYSDLTCVGRVLCNLSKGSNAEIAYMCERRDSVKNVADLSTEFANKI